jgi:hypothetical protein
MMIKRAIGPGAMIAVLAVSGLAGAVAAQDELEPMDPVEEPAAEKSTTGTVVLQEEDGRTVYYLDPGEGGDLIQLSYGPAWFWGALNPLDGLEGTEVTIGGQLRDGMPNENASDTGKEHAAKAPAMRVRSIDGDKRKGKPAWAGGPKVVGESHPGYKDRSEGDATKAGNKPEKPAKAAKPAKP